jgi:hypothetical protein
VRSRRSLLVFRRGVRDAASENARPGFSISRAVSCQSCRLVGKMTSRELDKGGIVL